MPDEQPKSDADRVVMIVDDDLAVLTSLAFALEVEGFVVRAYNDPAQILASHLVGSPGTELEFAL